jgi:PAS domain S-box-containing protein
MDIPLRVLIIEDSDRDVALEVRTLKAAGYQVTYAVAETAVEMKAALAEQAFDIVISDHGMPQFDASGALAVLMQSGLDIPFIIVSGAIGEETAVALMKAGAHDYVMKDRLARLVPAVQKELRDAESRREHKRAEETLRESEEKFRTIFNTASDGILIADPITKKFLQGNTTICSMLGYTKEEIESLTINDIHPPKDISHVIDEFEKQAKGEEVLAEDLPVLRKDGSIFYADISSSPAIIEGVPCLLGIFHDITERKRAEEKLLLTLESLRKAFGATIQVLVSAVETRDPYTAGHQRRVVDLARAIAVEMNLKSEQIDSIRMASMIHDIGKISIPSEILSKPTKLTDLEFNLIKTHSQSGYDILKDIEFPWPVADFVLQHHERMDGSGYPRGLKGEEILIEARILAVADVVEAMASHRPYRPALGIDAALEEIEKKRGLLYDSHVVDACLRVFREKGYQIEGT